MQEVQWNGQKKNGISYSEVREPNVPKEICENKEFNQLIVADLKRIALEAKLNSYEMVPAIHLDHMFWTPDNGLVTDAMKNKRDPLLEYYQSSISKLYAELGQ